MLQNGLLVWYSTTFSKPIKEMSKEELNVLWKARKEEERWHVLQKFIHEIHKSRHLSFPSLAATQQTVLHYFYVKFGLM